MQFDCLHYHVSNEELGYQYLSNVIDEVISYCIRPANRIDIISVKFVNTHGQTLSFEELRRTNITTKQLLSWSAPTNLAERYGLYMISLDTLLNERFYNCTHPWFGSLCQYSFELTDSMSIDEVVAATFNTRMPYNESSDMMTQLPCYTHLRCDLGGSLLCLDWREVCDGLVDCLDGGLDEAFCFEMEINECEEHEYRCHNGLCIAGEFWEDGLGSADCLDRSDESDDVEYPKFCFRDPTFRCEEHLCRINWYGFACGDGQTCGQHGDEEFCTPHRLISDEDILCRYYTNNPKERSRIVSDIVFEGNIYSWSWKGNRRLQPRIWTLNRNFELQRYYKSSYYGHLCQYQSERVSLTLGFVAGERTGAFTILIMLISEDGEIDSFDQLVYTTGQSCSVKFNRYLLFSRRPKDLLKNYSVRINAFGKGRL
jgi:hypothetical protein